MNGISKCVMLAVALAVLGSAVMISFAPVSEAADGFERPPPNTSGRAGDGITWTASYSYTRIEFSGSGEMYDYAYSTNPDDFPYWAQFNLRTAVIGEGITSIGDMTFRQNINLTNVTIPSTIIEIGSDAFRNTSITSVSLPPSLVSIGSSAFAGTKIESVTIPDSVTSIGNNAFAMCFMLKNAVVGKGVTSISQGLFADSLSLESLVIGENVESIGRFFLSGSSLEYVHIPAKVKMISQLALSGRSADGLAEISVDEDNPYFSSDIDTLYNKDRTELVRFLPSSGRTSVTVPESVVSVMPYAFGFCGDLTEISLPSTLSYIGGHAFTACGSLRELTIPDSVVMIDAYGIDAESLDMLDIGDGVVTLTPDEVPALSSVRDLHIGKNVSRMDYSALRNNGNLESVTTDTYNQTYTSIAGVLYNKEVTYVLVYPASLSGHYIMPNSVRYVGDNVFGGTNVTSITFSNSLYAIGVSAFAGTPLEKAELPRSLMIIGRSAFEGCADLEYVYFEGDTIPSMGKRAFAVRTYGEEPLRVYSPMTEGFMDGYSGNVSVTYNDSDAVYTSITERVLNNVWLVLAALAVLSVTLVIYARSFSSRNGGRI